MHVVITGVTSLRNRGVEAIVVPTLRQLRHKLPDATLTILTNTPDYDVLQVQTFGAMAVRNTLYPPVDAGWRAILRNRIYQPLFRGENHAANVIRSATFMLAAGGDVFTSDYGHSSLQVHLQPLAIALDAGVPVVFLAQTIGPFKTRADASAWLELGRRATLCTVREQHSYRYVTQELGLPAERVQRVADPAFLLEPAGSELVANLRQTYGLDDRRPTVALGVSQGIARYAQEDADRHVEAWLAVIRMLVEELGLQVLLFPHVQEISAGNDDRILATVLMRKLSYDPRVRLMGGDHTAAEFKGVIGSCDLVVSERMHGCIAGLSMGVATLAVGYSVKAKGIMADLLGEEAAEEGLLVPISDFLDSETAKERVQWAWERRHGVVETIRNALPAVKARAASGFDLILEVI